MDWLTAILVSTIISVGVSLTDKYMMAKVSAYAYTLLIGVVGLASLLFFRSTSSMDVVQWGFGISIGILFAVDIYATFRAYQQEEVSRLAPLSILSTVLITVGSAVFFGDHLSSKQLAAFGLFILGAILLATRFETRIDLDSILHFKIEPKKHKQVFHDIIAAAHDPGITWIRFRKKLKLIKGLGWYIASVLLYIPYTLLAKQLDIHNGALDGWVAIRVGLFLGALLLMAGHWKDLLAFTKTKLLAIGAVKEGFGMTANLLVLVAMTTGPAGIVQSLLSAESVGILVVALILAKYGIIKESLAKRDVLQKAAGVALIMVATTLLFI